MFDQDDVAQFLYCGSTFGQDSSPCLTADDVNFLGFSHKVAPVYQLKDQACQCPPVKSALYSLLRPWR